jgi:N,N'-diacetyllegionaminate synthase
MSCIIIAEAGVNHNGSLEIAFQLIKKAAAARVDYIKFQTFKAETLVTANACQAEYQQRNLNSSKDAGQFEMLKKLELSRDEHFKLIEHCKLCGIKFLSTAFDSESMTFLHKLGVDFTKIPSGEITNLPYLEHAAKFKKPVLLSTGMSNLEEIRAALQVFADAGMDLKNITLLHCNTEYPTPFEDVNLSAMNSMRRAFPGVQVGYSDHTRGIEVAVAAVALGASVIEKHFTLDKTLPGPDHKASLEPDELKQMVNSIRNVDIALGNGVKVPSDSEKKNIPIARRSIVAACKIVAGEIFSECNLTTKRPETGISPMRWHDCIGQTAKKNYEKDELIEL